MGVDGVDGVAAAAHTHRVVVIQDVREGNLAVLRAAIRTKDLTTQTAVML